MNKFMYVFKNTWSSALQYRFDTFMILLLISLRLAAEIFFWNVYYKASGKEIISGYGYEDIITYYLVMNLFAHTLAQSAVAYTVSNDIKNGFISRYMIMPINLTGYYLAKDAAQKMYEMLIGIIALLPVFLIFHNSIKIYAGLQEIPAILLCLILSIILSFLIFINLSYLTFWFTDISNLYMAVEILIDFLSGGYFPLNILPEGIYTVVRILPFYYTVFFPINMMTSNIDAKNIFHGILTQMIWIILLVILAALLKEKGRKRYEAAGI